MDFSLRLYDVNPRDLGKLASGLAKMPDGFFRTELYKAMYETMASVSNQPAMLNEFVSGFNPEGNFVTWIMNFQNTEKKIDTIKYIRQMSDGRMGLKEAKDFVESFGDQTFRFDATKFNPQQYAEYLRGTGTRIRYNGVMLC